MSAPETHERKVWAAVLLSFFGYASLLYVGKPRIYALIVACALLLLFGLVSGIPRALATPVGMWGGFGLAAALMLATIVVSVSAAARSKTYALRSYNRWWVYGGSFAILIALATFAPTTLVERQAVKTYQLPSTSMAPTFLPGAYVVADQSDAAVASVARGDVIAFVAGFSDGAVFAARVVAGPGDVVSLDAGRPVINGESPHVETVSEITLRGLYGRAETLPVERIEWRGRYSHLITRRAAQAGMRAAPTITLRPDEFYVMGDDRENARDSFNSLGAIHRSQILGVITGSYWPP